MLLNHIKRRDKTTLYSHIFSLNDTTCWKERRVLSLVKFNFRSVLTDHVLPCAESARRKDQRRSDKLNTALTNQMGSEVLEGLRVSQSHQRPLSRKINKRIIAHPVICVYEKYLNLRLHLDSLMRWIYNRFLTSASRTPFLRKTAERTYWASWWCASTTCVQSRVARLPDTRS